MNAFTGGGTETEVWKDTWQTGQPAICLPGSPLRPAGKAASASEVCPAPHRPLETFPAAVVYWLSGNTHPLIRAEDCERASDHLFNYYDLIICGEQHGRAGSHRKPSGCGSAAEPAVPKAVRRVPKRAAGSEQESCAGEMTAVRVQPLPAPRFRPLPEPKQCFHLSKHPQRQRGRVRLTAALFANIQLTQHPSPKGADTVFSTDTFT